MQFRTEILLVIPVILTNLIRKGKIVNIIIGGILNNIPPTALTA